jgi:GH15 family glucan-1,4-alpha-glucosidase
MTEQPSVEALVERVREALTGADPYPWKDALAALDSLTAAYGKMEKERDEWEQRYTELLEAVGGTWPG